MEMVSANSVKLIRHQRISPTRHYESQTSDETGKIPAIPKRKSQVNNEIGMMKSDTVVRTLQVFLAATTKILHIHIKYVSRDKKTPFSQFVENNNSTSINYGP